MESQLGGEGTRRDIVRPAEGGEEVVESDFVGNVDGRELQADLVLVAVEQIVITESNVEQVACCNTVWVVVRVVRPGSGNGDQRRSVLAGGTESVGPDGCPNGMGGAG